MHESDGHAAFSYAARNAFDRVAANVAYAEETGKICFQREWSTICRPTWLVAHLAPRADIAVVALKLSWQPMGYCIGADLHFTLSDPAVALFRIEIPNQLDKEARIAQCAKEAPRVFVATVEPKVIQRWYNANPYWNGEMKQLPIRVFLRTQGHAWCQTIWVAMRPRMKLCSRLPDVSDFEWFLEGPC